MYIYIIYIYIYIYIYVCTYRYIDVINYQIANIYCLVYDYGKCIAQ